MANPANTDEMVLAEIAKAAEQYETYLEIAQVNQLPLSSDETNWVHDPSAPLSFELNPVD